MKKEKKFIGGVFVLFLIISLVFPVLAEDSESLERKSFLEYIGNFFDGILLRITGFVIEGNEVFEIEESVEEEVADEPVEEVLIPPMPPTSEIIEEVEEEIIEEGLIDGVEEVEEDVNETVIGEGNQSLIDDVNESLVDELNESVVGDLNESVIEEGVVDDNMVVGVVNETIIEAKILNESVMGSRVVVGQQVKWVKKIIVEESGKLEVELPKEARDIVVKTGESARQAGRDIEEMNVMVSSEERKEIVSLMTGKVIKSSSGRGIINIFLDWLLNGGITGNVVYQNALSISVEEDSLKVDLSDVSSEEEIAIEYFTEAPQAREELFENRKRVIISAPSELEYKNILAYSVLETNLRIEESEKARLRLYWIVEGERIQEEYDAYDLSGDGLIDYIEWNVPHLSEQEYEIILITEAMHLDSEKEFVRDIFQEVSELDGVVALIPEGDFVRVVFEKELDETKDVTVYGKASCEEFVLINEIEVPCDVYYKKLRLEELRMEEG